MKFSTTDLHANRQWRAAVGLDQKIIDKDPLLIDATEQPTRTRDRQRPQASEYQQGLYSAKKAHTVNWKGKNHDYRQFKVPLSAQPTLVFSALY